MLFTAVGSPGSPHSLAVPVDAGTQLSTRRGRALQAVAPPSSARLAHRAFYPPWPAPAPNCSDAAAAAHRLLSGRRCRDRGAKPRGTMCCTLALTALGQGRCAYQA